MKYDPDIHHRRSIRLHGHDYAELEYYFVTICTQNRRPLFGTIANGRMALNEAGHVVVGCLSQDGMLACLLADMRKDPTVQIISYA